MIRLADPAFDAADLERVRGVLDSGMLVQGANVAAFEGAIEELLGLEAVACSSGTAALHLALMALGIGPDDEVVVPAFTWPSAAHTVVLVGARPVFVDIDPDTLNLDPARLVDAIGPATRAIVPIHQFGIPAPMAEVMDIARARELRVVEDAACAIGTTCADGRYAGTIGDLGCFSFHPRKVVTTGEGGAIVGADADLVSALRRLRNHGQDPAAPFERFVDAAPNYRLTEIGGALGVGQMARLPAILEGRRRLGRLYLERLADFDWLRVPAGVATPGNNFQSFVVDVGTPARRDALMARLRADGIECTIGTYAVPAQPVYRTRYGVDPAEFPHAVAAMNRLLTLPLHPGMTVTDIARVAESLAGFPT